MEEFSYTIPDRLESLVELRAALRAWLREAGVEPGAAEDVVLAAWEVCANAVEHPADRQGSSVTLMAQASPQGVEVAVSDTGSWRPSAGPQPGRGLGLGLAHGLTDRMLIRSRRPGTEVVMWRSTGRPA